ncbi:MAG TPA: ribbon-helix-helix protein, CopG family [Thermoanaerobaculia bacterium]|nr:ribbon-helix-helix protein, CopG family [Thermoanaerobaculia bacterium]
MATATVKSTYALDVETVRALEEMASGWGVSKSEALRRAIRAALLGPASGTPTALAALDELQRSLDLTSVAAGRWEKKARAERRAAPHRREPR